MQTSFVIDQVSWHTRTPGNTETREHIVKRFYVIAKFLQDNELSLRQLVRDEQEIDDEFCIASGDLTEEGLAVMKSAYDKWLQKVDNGMPPEDLTILNRALSRIKAR